MIIRESKCAEVGSGSHGEKLPARETDSWVGIASYARVGTLFTVVGVNKVGVSSEVA